MKSIVMIPARLGSKRIHDKNIRLIAGKPLVSYIIESVIESGAFSLDEIYLNSESEIMKFIADDYGINFYKRPEKFSSDAATNDDFLLDFINNINCDLVFQFLPTSPFVSPSDIREFYDSMIESDYDTLISMTNVQIECMFENRPLNFKQKEKTPPSQSIEPVKAYACGLMAWVADKFKENMTEYNSGYHGGDGKTGFFTIGGFASVDIDTVDDFLLAERIMDSLNNTQYIEPEYYNPKLHSGVRSEVNVPLILKNDGVEKDNYEEENRLITNIDTLLENEPNDSWMHRLVNTENNSCCIIHQRPGEGNRRHYHPSWNEWWYILKGQWDFEIEGEIRRVRKGDLVFIPKNKWHCITCVGDEPAARLAVSRADVAHVYKNE
jgi:CMP-N,N'-diacetyllegionaminic acid synthase